MLLQRGRIIVIVSCIRLGLAAGVLLTWLSACDVAPTAGDESVGTLSMPLITVVNGIRYRLTEDRFSLSGALEIDELQHNGDGSIVVATLPEGDYEVTLHEGWVLERQTESGFEPIEAELASPNPRPVHVESEQTTTVVWLFQTDGPPVVLEPPGLLQGNLGVADSSNPGTNLVGDVLVTEPAHVDALDGIVTIEGSLSIEAGVASVQALSALTHIDGDLSITGTALTSLDGLDNLAGVTGTIAITNNPTLPTCSATALLARLGFEPTEVNVSGNDDAAVCP
jgi:hypothetical protein